MASVAVNVANFTSATSTASNTSGASLTASVGNLVLIFCTADNNGTNGASSTTTCVDSDGVNVYSKIAEILNDPGAAGAGTTLTIYASKITQALSNDTFTVSFSPNTTVKCAWAWRVSAGAGEVVDLWSVDTVGAADNNTTHSAPTVNVPDGFVVFGAAAIETNATITGDADTTGGAWVNTTALQVNNGGSNAASQTMLVQYKIVSAAGNQDWACTTAAGQDSARTTVVVSVDTLRGAFLLDSSRLESALMIPVGLTR